MGSAEGSSTTFSISPSEMSDAPRPLLFERNHCMTLLALTVEAGIGTRWLFQVFELKPEASSPERKGCGVAGGTISPFGGTAGAASGVRAFSDMSGFSFIGVSKPFVFERGLMELRMGATMTVSVFRLDVFLPLTVPLGLSSDALELVSAIDGGTWTLEGRRVRSFRDEGIASLTDFWL